MDRPPIDGGIVTFADGKVTAVGARPSEVGLVEDLGDVALLPGLINAHTHLEFSDLARPLGTPKIDFVDWIRLVIERRSTQGVPPHAAVNLGLAESLRCGVTTVCDISATIASAYAGVQEGPDVMALLELIAFSQDRARSACAALEERLQTSQEFARTSPVVEETGVSPHAPYTVSLGLVASVARRANEGGLPLAMHLAESLAEMELLSTGGGPFRKLLEERSMWDPTAIPPHSRPLDYLRQLIVARRSLVIHGTHLGPEEIALLAEARDRASLVYCPRTHSYFNSPPYPLTNRLQAGVRVVLGTDSRASSPDLNVLSEARHAAAQHPELDPRELLRMATTLAAEALGWGTRIGSITPGKYANLTAVPVERRSDASPAEAIVHGEAATLATWHRGRQIGSAWH